MACKGPRSKLDHETRARRQKAIEAPREPIRPRTHWDHVIEEMIWLSKDFESERKWKLAQAKRVAIRAGKNCFDQATKGERRIKEEELRVRKLALNISKDVKKFWTKIEKLVLYKHQLELEERKKKALDKQLDFLLGQTERYSTMLAENLVDTPYPSIRASAPLADQLQSPSKNARIRGSSNEDSDGDYDMQGDEHEDDEHTIEEDEAHITQEERREELTALQQEADLPLEELLKRYTDDKASRELSPEGTNQVNHVQEVNNIKGSSYNGNRHLVLVHDENCSDEDHPVKEEGNKSIERKSAQSILGQRNGEVSKLENELSEASASLSEHSSEINSTYSINEMSDSDYLTATEDEKDDETTLSEEEKLSKEEHYDPSDELRLLQQESELPVEDLLARYQKDNDAGEETGTNGDAPFSKADCVGDGVDKSSHMTADTVVQPGNETQEGNESENIIADAAAAARSAQPTGNTFSTTKVRTKFPFLLKFPLREYQHIGLDWLVTMYEQRLNGILADEMGLGKTIMTIALLAHLACEKGIWGPHLIVVPTSVMLSWETEFLKWCPAFKILTYFGSAKERRSKRQGWLKPNSFHVCITTYRLVIQDSKVFKRKKWKYLILDEAHLIKNWKSQRWQTLLNFNSKRRILLTGTPLQNDLMELWSLMHFLMPHVFQSHQEFKDWFSNPISGMVEGQEKVNKEVVDRLHNVLRPFILRRLKRDVEKQLPKKHEHVIYCRLSKRQRNLYEDFIASSETQATLASANFFGMISVIMQLRKVCNHPDLFEGRPIISSFDMTGVDLQVSSSVCMALSKGPFLEVDLDGLSFVFTPLEFGMNSWEADVLQEIVTSASLLHETLVLTSFYRGDYNKKTTHGSNIFEEIRKAIWEERVNQARERAASVAWWNSLRCQKKPVYGTNLRKLVTIRHPVFDIHEQKRNPSCYMNFSSKLADAVLTPIERFQKMVDMIESFMFAIPAARAPYPICWCSKSSAPVFLHQSVEDKYREALLPLLSPIRPAIVRHQVYFPDRRLIQFDCGKLQQLAVLLRRLKSEGHRALIFTQMTKMLDILEAFINLYGYTYMRLDGSTQPEQRQTLMQRFNTNSKIFLFILSTRSGGVGINLVGADTVIFYDSDWNPAMDQQAQDRCHRIGQTREVHIYRLVCESTIEENILKKANQKRALDDLVIQSGSYNTEFFKKLDPMELFSGHRSFSAEKLQKDEATIEENSDVRLGDFSSADMEAALKNAEDEADYMALKKAEEEEAVDNQEFTEEAVGRLDDDDYANDDDLRLEDKNADDNDAYLNESHTNNDRALTLSRKEEDLDIIAHVKQMAAAAAAAGEASSSFESQLRPLDRYAMRFLDLWDPIVDKSAIETQFTFEEEWELERIEKMKDDLEAEIDEDEEPFIYEKWDTDFATEAYRQQVEALAQRQLMEELEEAKEMETADDEDEAARREALAARKRKSKKKAKKAKKAKFKSLKKEALENRKPGLDFMQEELPFDPMSTDDQTGSSSDEEVHSPSFSLAPKKRKNSFSANEEKLSKKGSNKFKKARESSPKSLRFDSNNICKKHSDGKKQKYGETMNDLDPKPVGRSKMGGKISITTMPIKRVLLIKSEKQKKKGSIWSKDCIPPPDAWSSQEDAILCAVVHEYSTHWALASDVIYGMTAGGFYRGRFRHPLHCCERFRELCLKYVLPTTENPNNEKAGSTGTGKALLKVTEEHVSTLLDATAEVPDNELLLQKHFTAILTSVWRLQFRSERRRSLFSMRSRLNSSSSSGLSISDRTSRSKELEKHLTVFPQNRKLVAQALEGTSNEQVEEPSVVPLEVGLESELLNITLEFLDACNEVRESMPSLINLTLHDMNLNPPLDKSCGEGLQSELSCKLAENRFRLASSICCEGEVHSWASSSFIISPDLARSRGKSQLGKHKASSELAKPSKSKLLKISEPIEETTALLRRTSSDDAETSFFASSVANDELPTLPLEELLDMEERLETVFSKYEPDVIKGLDDCLSMTEDITDIG